MKTLFLSTFVASMLIFTSCGNPIDRKIDKLEKAANKVEQLKNEGKSFDDKEIRELQEEAFNILKELKDEELTQEQKDKVYKRTFRIMEYY